MLKGLIKYKFITILCLWSSLFSQDDKLSISILDFKGDGVNDQILKFCYQKLETNLIESNRFIVIAKDKRDEILKEWEWQGSGACDEECVVQIGDMLGAKYLMVGDILGFGELYQINIKIVDITKGSVVEKVTKEIQGGLPELLDGMTESSREITRRIASGSAPQQVMQQTGLPAAVQKTYGSVDISTDPKGANIFIDGVEVGVTPKIIPELETGTHNLILNYPGYERLQKRIMVEDGKTIPISEYLVPKTGSLSILSEPIGATVYLDDFPKGQTPLDVNDLPVKNYMIRLELKDYQVLERRITVQYAENTTQKYTLDPLPGKLNLFTSPGGVNILIGGKKYTSNSSGIATIDLNVGNYTITVNKDGYESMEKSISVKANDHSTLDINLKRLPAGVSSNTEMGFLSVTSSDESFRLKIQGIKEIQQLPLEYYELIHGTYNLKVFGMGFESKKKSVVIERQKTTKVEINLNPKERAKAVRYSLMFPGGGQFYEGSKSRMRGLIYAGTFIGTGALLSKGISTYSDENKLLDQYQANYQAASSAADIDATWAIYEQQSATVNDAQTNLMILSTTLVSAYLTSIIDSYFFSDL
jgi:hypothetical protein